MKTFILLPLLLLASGAQSGVIGGGTTGKTLEIVVRPLTAEVPVDRAEFQHLLTESVEGKAILIDGVWHVSELVDLKNRQIFARPLEGEAFQLKIIIMQE